MHRHTSQQFESELRQLKDTLLAMGGRCETSIRMAMRAIEERNVELAAEVQASDRLINAAELEVDDRAEHIMALRQPMGRDLRFVLTALKVVTDLERIGDEAVNLAERAEDLASAAAIPEEVDQLPGMGQLATAMLHDALDAFLEEDADGARKVLVMDDEVDAAYGRILQNCLTFMTNNSSGIHAAMAVASCAKYLERIADHATNIAEMVVYLARGEDVRHRGKR